MGAGASAGGVALPFESAEAALAAGKTEEEIDAWDVAHPKIQVYPVRLPPSAFRTSPLPQIIPSRVN